MFIEVFIVKKDGFIKDRSTQVKHFYNIQEIYTEYDSIYLKQFYEIIFTSSY